MADRTPRPGDGSASEGAEDVEVRLIHPFQAAKYYICPGCQQEIEPGVGHYVVVPRLAPDLRRHWHRPCWENRHRRYPGRGPRPKKGRPKANQKAKKPNQKAEKPNQKAKKRLR